MCDLKRPSVLCQIHPFEQTGHGHLQEFTSPGEVIPACSQALQIVHPHIQLMKQGKPRDEKNNPTAKPLDTRGVMKINCTHLEVQSCAAFEKC